MRDVTGDGAQEELLVDASPYGIRAASVADGVPAAFFIEWHTRPSGLGDVHAARVLGRMAGIDACIVDIGDGEEAFLPGAGGRGPGDAPLAVQIVCDAHGGKRARASRRPVLAGRTVAFRPGGQGIALSRRLREPAARRAVRAALDGTEVPGGALTVRAAAGACPDAVPAAATMLAARWQEIRAATARDPTPRRLWHGGGLLGRLLRDAAPPGIRKIAIDDDATLERARRRAAGEAPDLLPALGPADAAQVAAPLFERHDCAGRLQAALEPEVVLAGGARLTIEETRALAAIDVDTSRAASADAAETAAAVGREIVLRSLGGLIAIDFAGRGAPRRREVQLAGLKRALRADRVPHRVLGVTAGGVVEVNRQRLGPSLLEALTEPAGGALEGRRVRLEAVAHEAANAARREVASGARALTLRAAPALLAALAAPGEGVLEGWLGVPLALVADRTQPRGRYILERSGTLAAGSRGGRCSTR